MMKHFPSIIICTALLLVGCSTTQNQPSNPTVQSPPLPGEMWGIYTTPLTWFYVQYPPSWTIVQGSGKMLTMQEEIDASLKTTPNSVRLQSTLLSTEPYDFDDCKQQAMLTCDLFTRPAFAGLKIDLFYRPEESIEEVVSNERRTSRASTYSPTNRFIDAQKVYAKTNKQSTCEKETIFLLMPQPHYLYELTSCAQTKPGVVLPNIPKEEFLNEMQALLDRIVESFDHREVVLR